MFFQAGRRCLWPDSFRNWQHTVQRLFETR